MGLNKRADSGLLASLYELPNREGHLAPEEVPEAFGLDPGEIVELEPIGPAKHVFSHVEWHMTGYRVRLRHEIPKSYIAAAKEELKTIYALPNAFGRYTKMIEWR